MGEIINKKAGENSDSQTAHDRIVTRLQIKWRTTTEALTKFFLTKTLDTPGCVKLGALAIRNEKLQHATSSKIQQPRG